MYCEKPLTWSKVNINLHVSDFLIIEGSVVVSDWAAWCRVKWGEAPGKIMNYFSIR